MKKNANIATLAAIFRRPGRLVLPLLLLTLAACERSPVNPGDPGVVPKTLTPEAPAPATRPPLSPMVPSVPAPESSRPPGASYLDRNLTELAAFHRAYVRLGGLSSPLLPVQVAAAPATRKQTL